MNAVAEALQHYQQLAAQAHSDRTGSRAPWLEQRRRRAVASFTASGFPTRKQEAWRYTSLDKLLSQPFTIASQTIGNISEQHIARHLITESPAARLVFCDGHFVATLSHTKGLAHGITVRSLRAMLDSQPELVAQRFGSVYQDDAEVFSAINAALSDDGLWIEVSAGTVLEAPIEVLYISQQRDDAVIVSPRNLLFMNEGAQATVIEQYASLDESCHFTNHVIEIGLAPSARLEHYRLQDESRQAFHKSTVAVQQQAGSHYQGVGVSLGASWSRTDYRVRFAGQQASCQLNGLYIAADGQLNDFHLDIDHAVPGCHSNEHFKGILLGQGRAVFDGRVHVAADAQKTEAHLRNDNLLLSRSAEIDTKPQLEIFADDVQCSHGTTVGQIEDEQLFYLRSRGIDGQLARLMLCKGFAEEVLQGCSSQAFVDFVAQAIEQRL